MAMTAGILLLFDFMGRVLFFFLESFFAIVVERHNTDTTGGTLVRNTFCRRILSTYDLLFLMMDEVCSPYVSSDARVGAHPIKTIDNTPS